MHRTHSRFRQAHAHLVVTWQARTDRGAITDETALLGLLAAAAIAVAALVTAMLTGAIGRIDLGF